ncbi:5-deoxyglucuronate isomerase [Mycoplasma testudineum]|uniref:5-deoxyglucuronate isomerase n=1 Tax=Mycoplasma testudineum TaxID=244584 RepID=A0A4R6IBW3_9MOLU|nr:5-deoxy-glucuronate isomerase [Mycoplasma testudineum]OYD26479.1 myo-inositol catabolism protein [Mycoplasma testudineum]TDO18958.1 5-deoxyglucuronate isomerase [Mycoplasma testudineum]
MHLRNSNLKPGLNMLVNRTKRAKHMLLDVDIYLASENETIEFSTEKLEEKVFLLLTGEAVVSYSGKDYVAKRKSVFEEKPTVFHIGQIENIKIKNLKKSEWLIITSDTEKQKGFSIHEPTSIKEDIFGQTDWQGVARRKVRTVFDYSTKPTSNIVVGEVITKQGHWSSYLPHRHNQPEMYFFKFEKPDSAFGISVAGENAYIVRENDVNAVPSNLDHPVSAAPGYPLYYCWIIKNLKNDPWNSRNEAEEHLWLKDKNAKYHDF